MAELTESLDFATFQGYDLAGPWDSATNHHSQLFSPNADPQRPRFSIDLTDRALIDRGQRRVAGHGCAVLRTRLDRGAGRKRRSLPAGHRPAAGTLEGGVEDYHVLATLTGSGFTRYWDGKARVPWLFDGTTFWSYEDPKSLKHKTDYVRHHDLGGVMFWELTRGYR